MKTLRFAVHLLALLPVFALAQNNTSTAAFGTIRGVITRAGNAAPVPGATVTLQGGNVDQKAIQALLNNAASQGIIITPLPGASTQEIVQSLANGAQARGIPLTVAAIQSQLASLSGGNAPTATSDDSGRFVFANLAPGLYTIRVQKEGYFGKPEAGTFPPTAAVDVPIAGQETKDANVSMIPGTLIGGRVYDVNGQILSNAIINALRVTYPMGHAVLSGQVSKTADDRGEFRLFWMPPGEYYLTAEPPRAAANPGAGPVGQGNKIFYPGVAKVTEAKPIIVNGSGEEILGMDIGIRSAPTFKVSGQVNSLIPPPVPQAGAPVVNQAVLVLLSPDGNAPDDTKQVGSVSLIPTSGKFEVSNVLPGVYDLFARVADPGAQAVGGAPQAWGRARLDISNADVSNVTITINPSLEVKGRVTASVGKLPPSLRVQMMPDEPSAAKIPAYQQVSRRLVPVSAEGDFSLPAIPEGRFRIGTIIGLPQEMYIADVRQDAQSVFDSGFDVNAKNTSPLEILLRSYAGTVNGTVLDGPTKVASGATVVLIPDILRRSNHAQYFTAISDASGHFTLRGVSPGDYKIFAWESIQAFAHVNSAFMANYENRGKPVHVGESGTVATELTLIPVVSK